MIRGSSRARRTLLVAILVGTVTPLAVACSGTEGGTTDSTLGSGTTIADDEITDPGALDYPAYSDPSAPIYVALGRRFALRLQSEPGAGYSWQMANRPNEAIVIPLGTQLRSDNPGVPGAPAQQYISFAASGVGTTTIEVRYVSPDGQVSDNPAPITFTVTVTFTGEPPPPPPPEPGTTLPFG
jgi:predicted secreted protein